VASFKQLAVDQAVSQRRSFALSELLVELALPLRTSIGKRPIKVELAIAPDLAMDSFPGPLAQVIGNLFDNCLVHAFEGDAGGTIRFAASARGSGQVAIAISDSGSGIPPELHGKLYDPFFTTKLGSGGSGLGLHVAHNIVTGLLGGRIDVSSEPGKGTTFTLVLPLVAPGVALSA
jgi:signal transduction histidine kinase